MDTIKWGIISTANIGRNYVIPALQKANNCEVVALASRDHLRAEQMAGEMNIPNAYDSYQKLLEDPGIDAVYNPLPNHLHVPVTMDAMEAGKHVLCEKPIALDAAEAEKLVSATEAYPNIKVMEAFMYRFHPQWAKVKSLIKDGAIGNIMSVRSVFSYFNDNPDDIRNKPDIGGGGLMDIGCYSISSARYIFEAEPDRVTGNIVLDKELGIDKLTSGILTFGDRTASFTCSTQSNPYQHLNILGTSGQIIIEFPFNPPGETPARFWLRQNGTEKEIKTEAVDQYTIQGEAFARAVLEDQSVPTPLTDALNNMRVIDAIKQSALQDKWIAL